MKIKKGDFVKIQYTGSTAEGFIFDTTDEKTAQESGLGHTHAKGGALTVCVGQVHVLEGIDKRLDGAEVEKEYEYMIPPEEAFGKKSAKLIQLMATNRFREEDIVPQPGVQVNVDNQIGVIKSVSGGRTLVDFNHPLAGQEVKYKVKVISKVEDTLEQAKCVIENTFHLHDPQATLEEKTLKVVLEGEVPKEVHDVFEKKVTSLVPAITKVVFEKPKKS